MHILSKLSSVDQLIGWQPCRHNRLPLWLYYLDFLYLFLFIMLIEVNRSMVDLCAYLINYYNPNAPGEDCDLWLNIFHIIKHDKLYHLDVHFIHFLLHTNLFETPVPIMCEHRGIYTIQFFLSTHIASQPTWFARYDMTGMHKDILPLKMRQQLVVALTCIKFCFGHFGLGLVYADPNNWTRDEFKIFHSSIILGGYDNEAVTVIVQHAEYMLPGPSEDFRANDGVVINFILVDQFLFPSVSGFFPICCDSHGNDRQSLPGGNSHIDASRTQKDTTVNTEIWDDDRTIDSKLNPKASHMLRIWRIWDIICSSASSGAESLHTLQAIVSNLSIDELKTAPCNYIKHESSSNVPGVGFLCCSGTSWDAIYVPGPLNYQPSTRYCLTCTWLQSLSQW